MHEKLKSLIGNDTIFFAAVVVLVAFVAFGLGRQSVLVSAEYQNFVASKEPSVHLVANATVADDVLTIPYEEVDEHTLVASRNGGRYYRLDCSGVGRIQDENRIYFPDVERARAAGYTPAVSCFE